MGKFLRKWHWIAREQFGIDVKVLLRGIGGIVWFFRSAATFRKIGGAYTSLLPCLHDRFEASGNLQGEYFWQDLTVAREIFSRKPLRHIDVGSRVDGFVAHVASFREIEVVDVRQLDSPDPQIIYRQCDMTVQDDSVVPAADSVSCLHALEHFGLGRYGDALAPDGHLAGVGNLAKLVASNGVLYLSVPIGKPQVLFNANRVLDPFELVKKARSCGLVLEEIRTFEEGQQRFAGARSLEDLMARLNGRDCVLGLFTFRKS